jgi:diguanylate cyclase (GGDEF)-like protein/PAS domain S-box-containing protein
MDYNQYSKEALIKRIEQLERLNKELLRENNDFLDFAWTGNLGRWYLDLTTGTVVFNPLKIKVLGYEMSEIPFPTPYSFFTNELHPDDYASTMKAMLDAMNQSSPVYECEYRIKTKDGSYKWYYDRGTITQRDKDGKALFAAGIVFDVTNKKDQEQKLMEENKSLVIEASTDPLTGIANRRALQEELEQLTNPHLRVQRPLSIILFDIDYFKQFNDDHGHLAGDRVLKAVANELNQSIRGFDTLGRYGGEEFLVILPNTDLQKAHRAAERARQSIEALVINGLPKITISGGVVQREENESIDAMIDRADRHLYRAKNEGRNRIC